MGTCERGWWLVAGTWQVAALSAGMGLAVAVVSITAAGPWEGGQRTAERAAAASADGRDGHDARRPPPVPVLSAVGVSSGRRAGTAADLPLPTRRGLREALQPLLEGTDLGSRPTAAVMDATTGRLLYGVRQDTPTTPASTMKIATTVAALDVLGPEHRIPTSVTQGAKRGEIVLVGGGDPTLTALGGRTGPDRPASLPELARATASALKDRGARSVRLRYDASAYRGPLLHPIGVNTNLAPVSALMADEGRTDPRSTRDAPRVEDPAEATAATFAGLLRKQGIDVRGKPSPGRSAKGGEGRLAEVRSLPVGALVERTLTESDNDIAEALARQVAMAVGKPASFDGAARAVTGVLKQAGMPVGDADIRDGSGLSSDAEIPAGLLARLLALAASPERPELRPVLSGLPVAGFTGTLRNRYQPSGGGGASAGSDIEERRLRGAAGLVRAKTGTLTGVNTLAGTVVDADGRLLTFAFMAKGASGPKALDALAAAVARCGCR